MAGWPVSGTLTSSAAAHRVAQRQERPSLSLSPAADFPLHHLPCLLRPSCSWSGCRASRWSSRAAATARQTRHWSCPRVRPQARITLLGSWSWQTQRPQEPDPGPHPLQQWSCSCVPSVAGLVNSCIDHLPRRLPCPSPLPSVQCTSCAGTPSTCARWATATRPARCARQSTGRRRSCGAATWPAQQTRQARRVVSGCAAVVGRCPKSCCLRLDALACRAGIARPPCMALRARPGAAFSGLMPHCVALRGPAGRLFQAAACRARWLQPGGRVLWQGGHRWAQQVCCTSLLQSSL